MVDTARKIDATNSAPAVRDLTLDVVKGALVVVMVVYHAMNIFSTAGPDEYAYVRFVSGSFILMSGYIVARFDGPRFKADWRDTSRRLVARGLKLLILFTLLNLLINLTGIGNPDKVQLGLQGYTDTLFEVYVAGEPRYASFQILLPIAYLLVAAPTVLMLGRLSKWLFVASFATAFALSLLGIESVNLDFAVLGAIGLSGGILTNSVEKPLAMTGVWSTAGSLLASVILMKYLSANLATYAFGTMVILKLLYELGKAVGPESPLARALILLGRYSLICYIAQIIFMQVLSRGLSRPRWELGYETILVVVATVGFLLVLGAGLAMLCDRYRFAAKAYKFTFS
jgi:acyltransferase-like protein